jgi:hypothetical protein
MVQTGGLARLEYALISMDERAKKYVKVEKELNDLRGECQYIYDKSARGKSKARNNAG